MAAVRTHVALLRGVNVGGRNRVPMGDVRSAVEAVGGVDVVTYLNSGNAVFGLAAPAAEGEVAGALEQGVAERTGVHAAVVVVTAERLQAIAAANPFTAEGDANPKTVHVVFRLEAPDDGERALIELAGSRARAKGSPDRMAIAEGCLYLLTPAGIGRSVLGAELAKVKGDPGTARNWATVTQLRALLDS